MQNKSNQNISYNTSNLSELLQKGLAVVEKINAYEAECLRKENYFLSDALVAQRKLVSKHPGLSETIPSQDKQEAEELVNIFNFMLDENNHKLQQITKSKQ